MGWSEDECSSEEAPQERKPSSKVLNRRPAGFWAEFNDWARAFVDQKGRRPSTLEVEGWYTDNSARVWPDPSVRPTLLDTRVHGKSLRSTEAVKNYFRLYRSRSRNANGETTQRKAKDSSGGGHAAAADTLMQPAMSMEGSDTHEAVMAAAEMHKRRQLDSMAPVPRPPSQTGDSGMWPTHSTPADVSTPAPAAAPADHHVSHHVVTTYDGGCYTAYTTTATTASSTGTNWEAPKLSSGGSAGGPGPAAATATSSLMPTPSWSHILNNLSMRDTSRSLPGALSTAASDAAASSVLWPTSSRQPSACMEPAWLGLQQGQQQMRLPSDSPAARRAWTEQRSLSMGMQPPGMLHPSSRLQSSTQHAAWDSVIPASSVQGLFPSTDSTLRPLHGGSLHLGDTRIRAVGSGPGGQVPLPSLPVPNFPPGSRPQLNEVDVPPSLLWGSGTRQSLQQAPAMPQQRSLTHTQTLNLAACAAPLCAQSMTQARPPSSSGYDNMRMPGSTMASVPNAAYPVTDRPEGLLGMEDVLDLGMDENDPLPQNQGSAPRYSHQESDPLDLMCWPLPWQEHNVPPPQTAPPVASMSEFRGGAVGAETWAGHASVAALPGVRAGMLSGPSCVADASARVTGLPAAGPLWNSSLPSHTGVVGTLEGAVGSKRKLDVMVPPPLPAGAMPPDRTSCPRPAPNGTFRSLSYTDGARGMASVPPEPAPCLPARQWSLSELHGGAGVPRGPSPSLGAGSDHASSGSPALPSGAAPLPVPAGPLF